MCLWWTHKVRSLGMWLKLDTGMVLMLLLFKVLRRNQSHLASAQQEFTQDRASLLKNRRLSCQVPWSTLGLCTVGLHPRT
jgi:hypothetical protein